MSKTIVAVRGRPNSGKTTSIQIAHERLARGGERYYSSPRCFVEIKEILKIDDVLVGFTSAGDTPSILERNLPYLFGEGCLVIVCAARINRNGEPDSSTISTIMEFAEANGFDIRWIDKGRDLENQRDANGVTANQIVDEVRQAIQRAQLVEA